MNMEPKMPSEILPEIIHEILSNLPVESLLRFRSVCKSWKSLISSTTFQQDHYRRRCHQKPLLLIASTVTGYDENYPEDLELSTHNSYDGDGYNYITEFEIPFPVSPTSYSCGAIQQCRGLVCVTFAKDIYICNPATRNIIALPAIEHESHCVGFGYAAGTKEFKVVRHFRSGFSRNLCEVFTLGSGEWREAKCIPPEAFSELSFHAPFLHEAIHFLADSTERKVDDAIYAFDVESEEYRTIRFPGRYYSVGDKEESTIWLCLSELKGYMCCTFIGEESMELWFLKDYDGVKWVKEYTMDVTTFATDFVWGQPLVIMGNGTILMKISEEHEDWGHLYWYNPEEKTFSDAVMENYTATMYVESLFPLVAPLR